MQKGKTHCGSNKVNVDSHTVTWNNGGGVIQVLNKQV